jgi:hypothetical protein
MTRVHFCLPYMAAVFASLGMLACSSSSTSPPADAGHPTKEGGSPSDARKPADAGRESGSADAGPGKADGPRDAGTNDVTSPRDAGGPFVATDADVTACSASAAAQCALYAQCNPGNFPGAYGDAGNCETRLTNSCVAGLVLQEVSVPTHTAACGAVLGTEPCSNYLNDDDTLDACAPVVGTAEAGTPCLENGQCASAFCATPPASACGSCGAQPSAGDSCRDLTGCGPGLACYKNICVVPTTTVGGPCSPTQSCGAGLSCVTPKDAGAGTCKTAATIAGAACDPTLETGAGCASESGLTCVSDRNSANYQKCEPYGVAQPGQPCGTILGVSTLCQGVSECFATDGGKVCVPRAADNAACNTLTGPACQAPSRCVGTTLDGGTSGTCTFPGSVVCK